MAAFFLLFGVAVSRAAATGQTHVLTRISNETGVPVDTLQTQKSATRLGNGELETANLLANASGKSFDDIVATHKAGEGWGKIAHDKAQPRQDRERRAPIRPGRAARPERSYSHHSWQKQRSWQECH